MSTTNRPVLLTSGLLILLFVGVGAMFNELTGQAFSAIQGAIVTLFGCNRSAYDPLDVSCRS